MRHSKLPRAGFTLIELLVVIALIAVLATLALAVAPRFSDSQKSAMGASKLQGWFAIAKQRAYRDKLVWGVELLPGPTANVYTQARFVVQPDDFWGGTISWTLIPQPVPNPPSTTIVTITGTSFYDSNNNLTVQPGDYLDIYVVGDPVFHFITGVTPTANGATLTLATPLTTSFPYPTTQYRIIRQPRAVAGEPVLQLPADMCVHVLPFGKIANPNPPPAQINDPRNPSSPLTMLFTPWGGVHQKTTTAGKAIYWVCDQSKDTPFDGEPTMIVVYSRTGAAAAHPFADLSDPYRYVRDGSSSGL